MEPITEEERKVLSRLEKSGLPTSISRLRQKLCLKAKREPKFRFYTLFGHICNPEALRAAWKQARANKGSAGVDRITFEMIEESEGGVDAFLDEIRESLRAGTYKPKPVRRTYIPKPDGRMRPLGIPCIKDRVVQTATVLILEPIFETDFKDCSYGFRPKRSTHMALKEIEGHLKAGYKVVYDADLKGYFDTIPHDKLMAGLETRIVDRKVLKLIRMWLQAPIAEPPPGGGRKPKGKRCSKKSKTRSEREKLIMHRAKQGTPQGGVISPLLANLYLHWFDRAFHGTNGPAHWANAKMVRYADDFVVMVRRMEGQLIEFIESRLENRLGLQINREKTSIVNLKEQGASLDFLGYTFRYDRDLKGRDHDYLNKFPSKKALAKEREKLRSMTDKSLCFVPLPDLIQDINQHLKGWSNAFRYGYNRKAFRDINFYVRKRLKGHLKRRSQRPFKPPDDRSYYEQLKRMGLIYL